MSRTRLRCAIVLPTVVLIALVLAPLGVLAAKPERFSETVNEQFVVDDVCPFPYTQTLVGTFNGKTWFNESGNPVAEISQFHVEGTFEANGVVVPFIIRTTDHVEFNADGSIVVITSGIIGRAVIPGEGLVGATIGRVRITIPADGSEPIFEFLAGQENEAEFFGGTLCDLLTP